MSVKNILANSRNLFFLEVGVHRNISSSNGCFRDYMSHIQPRDLFDFIRNDYDINAVDAAMAKAKDRPLEAVDVQCRVIQKTGATRWTWWEIQFYEEVFYFVGGDMVDVISIESHNYSKMQRLLDKIAWLQNHKVRKPAANIIGLSLFIENHKGFPLDEETSKIFKMASDSAHELDQAVREITELCNSMNS
jgi:hypothetical protein